jgi:hypothetical protein
MVSTKLGWKNCLKNFTSKNTTQLTQSATIFDKKFDSYKPLTNEADIY